MSAPSSKTIVVSGDVVVDCHLYGGVKTAATSFSEPGTSFTSHLGGAALTNELLQAASDVDGRAWDATKKKWEQENESRQKAKKPDLPWLLESTAHKGH